MKLVTCFSQKTKLLTILIFSFYELAFVVLKNQIMVKKLLRKFSKIYR